MFVAPCSATWNTCSMLVDWIFITRSSFYSTTNILSTHTHSSLPWLLSKKKKKKVKKKNAPFWFIARSNGRLSLNDVEKRCLCIIFTTTTRHQELPLRGSDLSIYGSTSTTINIAIYSPSPSPVSFRHKPDRAMRWFCGINSFHNFLGYLF